MKSEKTPEEILEGHFWALDRMRPTLAALFDLTCKSINDADDIGLWMHNDIRIPDPRLILETTTKDRRYLTGH